MCVRFYVVVPDKYLGPTSLPNIQYVLIWDIRFLLVIEELPKPFLRGCPVLSITPFFREFDP